jgi:hypothetical protein
MGCPYRHLKQLPAAPAMWSLSAAGADPAFGMRPPPPVDVHRPFLPNQSDFRKGG